MKKNMKVLLTLSFAGAMLFACGSPVGGLADLMESSPAVSGNYRTPAEEVSSVSSYAIVNASEAYAHLDGISGYGYPGQEYSFRVSLYPGYHFYDKLEIATADDTVPYTYENSYYTFTMPDAAVTITLDVGATDFTITNQSEFIEKIVPDDDSSSDEAVWSAVAGTKLKFRAEANADAYFTEVKLNGEIIEKAEDGYYHFVMPVKPVVITTDRYDSYYDITMDDLEISTAVIYTDPISKAPVTTAKKGDRVYIGFSYDVVKVDYTITVATLAGEEGTVSVEVHPAEDDDTFYFDMISADVHISVIEKDASAYYGHPLTDKAWKTWNLYGTGSGVSTVTYSEMSSKDMTFSSNGEGTFGTSATTWTVDEDDANHAYYSYGSGSFSYTKDVYFTDHLIATKYNSSATASWNDAYVGTCSSDYTVHALKLSTNNLRFIWIEDEGGAIIENILIVGEQVYVNVSAVKGDGGACLGEDISLTSEFTLYHNDERIVKISNGSIILQYNLTANADANCEIEFRNADGEVIERAENGETVYVYGTLKADAEEGYELEALRVTYGNYSVTVHKDENADNVWYFTMPSYNITATLTTVNPDLYTGYAALGTYVCYNYYSGNKADQDFSASMPATKNFEVTSSGRIITTGATYGYVITSMENEAEGEIGFTNGSSNGVLYYSGNLMLTAFSVGNTELKDVYIGVRLDEGVDASAIKVQSHWMSGSYAVSFYVNDVLEGSIFVTNSTVYMGVSFEFEEGSDRIQSGAGYRVVKGSETLFSVSGDTVSAASDPVDPVSGGFYGTWTGKVGINTVSLVLNSDGTGLYGDTAFTYTVSGNTITTSTYLTMTFDPDAMSLTVTYDDGDYSATGTMTDFTPEASGTDTMTEAVAGTYTGTWGYRSTSACTLILNADGSGSFANSSDTIFTFQWSVDDQGAITVSDFVDSTYCYTNLRLTYDSASDSISGLVYETDMVMADYTISVTKN